MSRYLLWNDAIGAHFFKPEMAGRDVHLYVNSELISQLARLLGVVSTDFIDAAKEGPPWATREGLCQRALQALEDWRRQRGLSYPPYIAYLALFVLAAGAEGDYAPYAYYPRLREILGYPAGSTLPSFDRMYELWDDLERWSVQDRRGEVGIFRARIIGDWIHVGLPIAQTILTEHERKALPRVFYEAGLDPTARPPAEELSRALRLHGAGHLQPRSLRLLTRQEDPGLYQALLATVADELGTWNGEVSAAQGEAAEDSRQTLASLRLCLQVDLVARKATVSLRCRLNREFPEANLAMSGPSISCRLEAEEFVEGWSTPLKESTGAAFDAGTFDWSAGLELEDRNLNWHFRLPARPVRVFITGMPEGLPGMIEAPALPKVQQFLLAYADVCRPQLERWISEGCRGVAEYGHVEGLPDGWHLVSISEAITDEKIRDEFPFISFPSGSPLRLVGGIRSSRGNNFFSFAPPDVYVEGAESEIVVLCNGQPLLPREGIGIYPLPSGLPLESRVLVEIQDSQSSVLARQSLYLTHDFAWQSDTVTQYFDPFGLPLSESDEGSVRIGGARVAGGDLDVSFHEQGLSLETMRIEFGSTPLFLIGQAPGQIARWPRDGLPKQWKPVWAVTVKRRHGNVFFCGTSLVAASPVRILETSRRKLQEWKELVWHRRKRITPPLHPAHRRLWKQYQEMARHV